MSYPGHEIIEASSQTLIRRREAGGSIRSLSVWSLDSCRKKLLSKSDPGSMARLFQELARWANEEVHDPMISEWRLACFQNCELAWEQLNSEEVEEFGA